MQSSISKYRITKRVGGGSFGDIYLGVGANGEKVRRVGWRFFPGGRSAMGSGGSMGPITERGSASPLYTVFQSISIVSKMGTSPKTENGAMT